MATKNKSLMQQRSPGDTFSHNQSVPATLSVLPSLSFFQTLIMLTNSHLQSPLDSEPWVTLKLPQLHKHLWGQADIPKSHRYTSKKHWLSVPLASWPTEQGQPRAHHQTWITEFNNWNASPGSPTRCQTPWST